MTSTGTARRSRRRGDRRADPPMLGHPPDREDKPEDERADPRHPEGRERAEVARPICTQTLV